MERKVILLQENPRLYQRTELNEKIRRFFVQKYVIFYIIEKNEIEILRILHQKSNYYKKIYIKSKKQKSLK